MENDVKGSSHDLSLYLGICLVRLKKTMKSLNLEGDISES